MTTPTPDALTDMADRFLFASSYAPDIDRGADRRVGGGPRRVSRQHGPDLARFRERSPGRADR